MDPADPPDISQIKNAFTTVQTKINLVIDDINKSLKVVSDATDYVEVAQ